MLAIVILVIAQILSVLMGEAVVMVGIPVAVGNLIAGILYPLFTYLGIKYFYRKIMNISLEACKVNRFSLKPLWGIAAVMMPCMVIVILTFFSGHWEKSVMSNEEKWSMLFGVVLFYGVGVGIVEELIFRGVIMSLLEYRYNKIIAILIPSFLFAALHIIGNDLGFISILQLLFAGSIVGILFSLVTYESGNIWNAALMHAVWNTIIGTGIIHIGNTVNENALYNYIIDTKSFAITGGEFGIEASIISVIVYSLFVTLAMVLINRKSETKTAVVELP